MIDTSHFCQYVIQPALETLELYSPAAEELLLGTAIQESGLRHLHQIGGPALGVFQIEPFTHQDLYANFLSYRPQLRWRLNRISPERDDEQLIYNLRYAAAVARLLYYRAPEALPDEGDVEGQAEYWKRYYNTTYGKGKPEEYIAKWNRYA